MTGRHKGQHDCLDDNVATRLKSRLRFARNFRGLTLKKLAAAIGCSDSMLSRIESGSSYPSLPMLVRLTDALNVSMGWLFDEALGALPKASNGTMIRTTSAERHAS